MKMPRNLDFLNLSSVFKSFSDKEILSPRRLVKKLSSLKRKGVKFVGFVKNKLDKTFESRAEIPDDEETEVEDQKFKIPLQRPKSCLCNVSKDQPKWRARINDIGSIARNSLMKSREPSAIPQPDIQEILDHSEMKSSLDKTEKISAIAKESLQELQSRRSSSFAKNNGILLGVNQLEAEISSQTPERKQSLQTSRKSSIKSPRTSFPLEMEQIKPIEGLQSRRSSSLAQNDGISLEINQLEDKLNSQTPERQQSLKTSRKSSIKSPRTSFPFEMEQIKPIEEIQSRRSSSLAKNNKISLEINQLEEKMNPQTPERQQSLQTSRKSSIKSPRTSFPLEMEQIKPIEGIQSRRPSSFAKNDRKSLEINQLEDRMKPQTPERQQSLQASRKSSIKSPRTSFPLAIEEIKTIEEPQSRRSSIAKTDKKSLGINQVEDKMKDQTAKRQQSLENPRKSSIKSPRTSLPLTIESMKPNDEVETPISSLKIEEITESAAGTEILFEEPSGFLFQPNGDKPEKLFGQTINDVVEKEEPIRYEMVNISRGDFDKMELDSRTRKVIRIDHKTLPPEEPGSNEEWKDVPIPVIDEINRLTKPKRPHKCLKACPCKFTQGLIDIYHESKLLSERVKEISEAREHCTLRMSSSEIDFFKKDTTMCNVMIGEIRSRRAEMRELMDMWQEANEKLKGRKKEIFSIAESIEQTAKRVDEVENLLKDWLPEGRMEKLRKAQRAIEKEDREKLESLEDEERALAKERIEEILYKQQSWQDEERKREEKRKNQRQQDMKALQNATMLMQKYIDERKALLVR